MWVVHRYPADLKSLPCPGRIGRAHPLVCDSSQEGWGLATSWGKSSLRKISTRMLPSRRRIAYEWGCTTQNHIFNGPFPPVIHSMADLTGRCGVARL